MVARRPASGKRASPATPARYRVIDLVLAVSVFINCVALAVSSFVDVPLLVWLVLIALVPLAFTARAVARRSLR
jgi:hypothetical protein